MATTDMKHLWALETWLVAATCRLTRDSVARVRGEMWAHYESAREEALVGGATVDEAHAAALASLGDPKEANKEYQKVHVTIAENGLLSEDRWISRVVCSRRYLLAVPLMALCAGISAFLYKPSPESLMLLVGGAGLSFVLGAPFIVRINTIARGRAYRAIRWAWLIAVMWLAYGPGGVMGSWPMFLAMGGSMLWIVAWADWNRMSLRRKIPVAQWPRGLYL